MSLSINVVMLLGSVGRRPHIESDEVVRTDFSVDGFDVPVQVVDPILASRFLKAWQDGSRSFMVQGALAVVDGILTVSIEGARGHDLRVVAGADHAAGSSASAERSSVSGVAVPMPAKDKPQVVDPVEEVAAVPSTTIAPSPKPAAVGSPPVSKPAFGGPGGFSLGPKAGGPQGPATPGAAKPKGGLAGLSKPKPGASEPEDDGEIIERRPVSRPDQPAVAKGPNANPAAPSWIKDENPGFDQIPF